MSNGVFFPEAVVSPKYGNKLPAASPGNWRPDADWSGSTARMYVFLSDAQKNTLVSKLGKEDPKRVEGLKQLLGAGYINFIVTGMSTEFREHVDVVDGIDDLYSAYAFGTEPPSCSFQVAFLNNKYDDQVASFHFLYEHCLRASKLAGLRTEATIQYADKLISGVLTNLQWALQASDESVCFGSFEMLVRKISYVPPPLASAASVTLNAPPGTIKETGVEKDTAAIMPVDVYRAVTLTSSPAPGDPPKEKTPEAAPAPAGATALATDVDASTARKAAEKAALLNSPGAGHVIIMR